MEKDQLRAALMEEAKRKAEKLGYQVNQEGNGLFMELNGKRFKTYIVIVVVKD